MTTVTAAPGAHTGGAAPASEPEAAAASSPASGLASRSSTTWVSGSPNRALNSTTRTPAAVRLSPAYSRPRYGVPRRRISSTAGWMTLASTSAASAGGAQPSGA